MIIVNAGNAKWKRAKKIANIMAKPMSSVIVDDSVISHFLLSTLEGREPIGKDSMFCVGAAGDVWQQKSTALLKKYDLISFDKGGWGVYQPKPENEVEFYQFTFGNASDISDVQNLEKVEFGIIGLFGETVQGVQNVQFVSVGDFVCRQVHDHADQWVVRKNLFNNTYSLID